MLKEISLTCLMLAQVLGNGLTYTPRQTVLPERLRSRELEWIWKDQEVMVLP